MFFSRCGKHGRRVRGGGFRASHTTGSPRKFRSEALDGKEAAREGRRERERQGSKRVRERHTTSYRRRCLTLNCDERMRNFFSSASPLDCSPRKYVRACAALSFGKNNHYTKVPTTTPSNLLIALLPVAIDAFCSRMCQLRLASCVNHFSALT